jgi:dTDP-4-dehydrorhamnose reductase
LKNKILVTGSEGQLGNSIKEWISTNNYQLSDFVFIDLKEVDLSNELAIRDFFAKNFFDFVFNCAAYTAVDAAESSLEIAYMINSKAVRIIAEECKKQNAILIHISTDYVFNGNSIIPYQVDDQTNPQNIYGKSKLSGEQLAFEENPKTIVIRTAWVYSPYGKNFVKTMLSLFKTKEEISVVSDQKGIPTLAIDLAEAMIKISESENFKFGIYHYTNLEETTWFDFASEIFKLAKQENREVLLQKINKITTKDYPTPAQRPMYSVLNCSKIFNDYRVNLYSWKESLEKVFDRIK